jgi:predicted porin
MKKSTLALAVAAALATSAAVADTTLYGSARVSVDYVSLDGGPDAWDVVNNASRLGVRGSEDLGGGLSAIYQYEFGVDVTEGSGGFAGNRPKWVGLSGDSWGSVTLGTQWTPYYNVAGVADIFNSSGAGHFTVVTGYLGSTWGTRLDNSLVYKSPNFSGFSAEAMLVANGSGAATNLVPDVSVGVDLWQIAGKYVNGPFYAGGAYMAINNSEDFFDSDNLQQWTLVGAYQPGPFTVGLLYEQGDLNLVSPLVSRAGVGIDGIQDTWSVYLWGSYTFGNNIIRAAYGYMEPDGRYFDEDRARVRDFDEIQNLLLGYQYNLSKRTRVWAEYLGRTGGDNADLTAFGDRNAFSMGVRHDF